MGGEGIQTDEVLPQLKQALNDQALANQAIISMGSLGKDGTRLLIDTRNAPLKPKRRLQKDRGRSEESIEMGLLSRRDRRSLRIQKGIGLCLPTSHGRLEGYRIRVQSSHSYDSVKKLRTIRDPKTSPSRNSKTGVPGDEAMRYVGSPVQLGFGFIGHRLLSPVFSNFSPHARSTL